MESTRVLSPYSRFDCCCDDEKPHGILRASKTFTDHCQMTVEVATTGFMRDGSRRSGFAEVRFTDSEENRTVGFRVQGDAEISNLVESLKYAGEILGRLTNHPQGRRC